jgi:uncharacterized protein
VGKESIKIKKILEEFKSKVEKLVNLDKMILFGSQARGEETENSDIDIIIVSEDFENQKSFRRAGKFYLEWDYNIDSDIICLTPKELEEKKNKISIIKTALKEGIILN